VDKLTENEKAELDIFDEIIEGCPGIEDDLFGTLIDRYDLLLRKRNAEYEQTLMGNIVSALAEEITAQIDKDIIEQITGKVAKSMAIPSSMLDPNKNDKVAPDADFNYNDPWIIGVKNEIYTPPLGDIITPGKSGWDLILTQNQPGWVSHIISNSSC
jgi:hypothetical protein